MKRLYLLFVLATLAFSSAAAAQPLGRAGDLSIGAERLFGFYLGEQDIDLPAPVGDVENDFHGFSLLWNRSYSFFNLPRLAVDYFIIDGLSLGGSFGIYFMDVEDADETGILFQARVGYHLNISDAVGFWPRGGFLFYTINDDDRNVLFADPDTHQFGLSIDGMFTLAPAHGWAFLIGPAVDFGITGEWNDNDLNEYAISVMAGMVGWVSL